MFLTNGHGYGMEWLGMARAKDVKKGRMLVIQNCVSQVKEFGSYLLSSYL